MAVNPTQNENFFATIDIRSDNVAAVLIFTTKKTSKVTPKLQEKLKLTLSMFKNLKSDFSYQQKTLEVRLQMHFVFHSHCVGVIAVILDTEGSYANYQVSQHYWHFKEEEDEE